uniref:Uncharacterized protein n=1 Tax=Arundo donax TaxID=35708 RepID=A0A0A9EQY5_ARUDO
MQNVHTSTCLKILLATNSCIDGQFKYWEINMEDQYVWEDSWLFASPLCLVFPGLYEICEEHNITMKHCVDKNMNLTFRR